MAVTFGFIDKSISAAGTAEALSATALWVAWALIQARGGNNAGTGANTGKIFIGPSTVTNSGTTGVQLPAPTGGAVPAAFRVDSADGSNQINLADLYVAVAVNGEGVEVMYAQRS